VANVFWLLVSCDKELFLDLSRVLGLSISLISFDVSRAQDFRKRNDSRINKRKKIFNLNSSSISDELYLTQAIMQKINLILFL